MAVKAAGPAWDTARPSARMRPALPARDFYDPGVFERDRERIFYRNWICVGRQEEPPRAGDFLVRDLVGESLLLVRGADDSIRPFYNVCRHRGSRLCTDASGHFPNVIRCPYHAWTYALDGRLVGTPNVGEVDGFDRAEFGLHRAALEVWEGFLFVNLADEPKPLEERLGSNAREWARYRLGNLVSARRDEYDCDANWKILVENYNECLHCPTVHPELVELVPIYRRGLVVEDDGFFGNRLGPGVTSWTRSGRSSVPPFPSITEEDRRTYWGFVVFPNMLVNLLPDVVTYELLWPVAPGRTHITYDYLFDPSQMSAPGFDPADIYEFRDMIVRQDLRVCGLAQRGVRSHGFERGILPPQDALVLDFEQEYLRERESPG